MEKQKSDINEVVRLLVGYVCGVLKNIDGSEGLRL